MDEISWQRQRGARSIAAQGLLAAVKGIADTGFLVAFSNKADRYHAWAVGIAEELTEPLLTCEAVLSKSAFHLGHAMPVFEMLRNETVTIAFDCNAHWHELENFARQYADRRPDFADLCIVRMSELDPRHPVVTIDRGDFNIYRRNRREVIPIICPPA